MSSAFQPVSELSEDEASLSDSEDLKVKRKRKRTPGSAKPHADRRQEQFLRDWISRPCKCKRKSCLQQFGSETLFSALHEYRLDWFDLAKVDQDNLVSQLKCKVLNVNVCCAPRVLYCYSLPC